MAGINKVTILGRLGNDPESRAAGETTVTNFSIATSEKFKNKQGDVQEKTEWHRIVAWGKLAEICAQYLTKGAQVYVEGKLQTRSWEKEGVKLYTTEIVISEMQMLGSKSDQTQSAGQDQPYRQPAAQSSQPSPVANDSYSDDLPF